MEDSVHTKAYRWILLETIELSFNEWVDKHTVKHPCNGTLLRKRREHTDMFNNTNESQKWFTEQKKWNTMGHLKYDSIYIKF